MLYKICSGADIAKLPIHISQAVRDEVKRVADIFDDNYNCIGAAVLGYYQYSGSFFAFHLVTPPDTFVRKNEIADGTPTARNQTYQGVGDFKQQL